MSARTLACPCCLVGLAIPEKASRGQPFMCPKCKSKLRVAADGSLEEGFQETATSLGGPDSALQQTQDSVPLPSPGENARHFLGPPKKPGDLGSMKHFRLLSLLGRGGMGAVYLAEDTTLQRQIALKVMLPEQAARADAKARFLREARTAASVENDHVVAIHLVDEDHGLPFLTMPLLKGESLSDRLKRRPPLEIPEVLRIGSEIAAGLAGAHEKGLVHRDLKPGNTWLESPKGRVKILDFGLARSVQGNLELSQSGQLLGTPAYMSPEQARSPKVDHRSDLFSLGVMMYQMLTGHLPFRGHDVMSLLTSLAVDQPRPPMELNGAISPEINDVVVKLLQKNPDHRFPNAKSVAEALDRLRAPRVPAPGSKGDANLAKLFQFDDGSAVLPWAKTTAKSPPSPSRPASEKSSMGQTNATLAAPPGEAPVPPLGKKTKVLVGAGLGLLALAGLIFLGGVLIRSGSDKGTLVVRIDDPDVEVSVKMGQVFLVQKSTQREFELTAGDGEVQVFERGSGLKLATKTFTLERNGKAVVDARMEVKQAQEKDKGKKDPPPLAYDRAVAEMIIKKGGSVGIVDKGVFSKLPLPSGDLKVNAINIQGNSKIVDDDLKSIGSLRSLTSLTLTGCPNITDDGIRWIESLKNLAYLGLLCGRVTSKSMDFVSTLSDLVHLNCPPGMTNADLLKISKLKKLQTLQLINAKLTDESLGVLKTMPELIEIYIHGAAGITDQGALILAQIPKLQTVNFTGAKITEKGWGEIAKLPNLREVRTGSPLTNEIARALATAPTLIRLDDLHTAEHLKFFKNHPSLLYLELTDPTVNDDVMPIVLTLKNLGVLNINGSSITREGYEKIRAAFPKCQIDSPFGDRAVAEMIIKKGGAVGIVDQGKIANLPLPPGDLKVETIYLHANPKIVDDDLKNIGSLRSLTSLDLTGCPNITDDGIRWIEPLKNLRGLYLYETRVTSKSMDLVSTLSELQSLHCPRGTTNADLGKISKLKKLRTLAMVETTLTDEGFGVLRTLPALTLLDIQGAVGITDQGALVLAQIPTLHFVSLVGAKITEKGWGEIAKLPNLERVQTGPPLTDEILRVFASVPKLIRVHNMHTAEQLKFFKNHPSLGELDLTDPKVNDDVVLLVITLKNLRYLNIEGSSITRKGYEQIKAALPNCQIDSPFGGAGAPGERAAALTALKHGFSLGVRINGRITPVKGESDLNSPFEVTHLNANRHKIAEDATLGFLKDLPNLEIAQLTNCPGVTDKTLTNLTGCKRLSTLILYASGVTDKGLVTLAEIKSLTQLDVKQLPLSEEAVKKLAAALPLCRIVWNQGNITPQPGATLPPGKTGLLFEGVDGTAPLKIPYVKTHIVTLETWVTVLEYNVGQSASLILAPNSNLSMHEGGAAFYTYHGHVGHESLYVLHRRVHLAGVNDGKKKMLFLDGKLVAQADRAGTLFDKREATADLLLGGPTLRMVMDAARVSTVARYTADFTPPAEFTKDADTLALYLFKEGKGNELKDSSGNGYHLRINGGKWVKRP